MPKPLPQTKNALYCTHYALCTVPRAYYMRIASHSEATECQKSWWGQSHVVGIILLLVTGLNGKNGGDSSTPPHTFRRLCMRFKVYDPNHHDIHLDHLGLSYARIRQDCAMKYTQWDQSQPEVAFSKHFLRIQLVKESI